MKRHLTMRFQIGHKQASRGMVREERISQVKVLPSSIASLRFSVPDQSRQEITSRSRGGLSVARGDSIRASRLHMKPYHEAKRKCISAIGTAIGDARIYLKWEPRRIHHEAFRSSM